MKDDVAVVVHLPRDVYRALVPVATRRGIQVHVMLANDATRAVRGEPKRRRKRSTVTDEQIEALVHMHAAGLSDSAIARKLGLPQTTVHGRRSALGLTPNVVQQGGRKRRSEVQL